MVGAYFDETGTQVEQGGQGITYFRMLGEIDFTHREQSDRFWGVLGDSVFNDAAILFELIDGAAQNPGSVRNAVEWLRDNPRYLVR